jgi:hypothetical protein
MKNKSSMNMAAFAKLMDEPYKKGEAWKLVRSLSYEQNMILRKCLEDIHLAVLLLDKVELALQLKEPKS